MKKREVYAQSWNEHMKYFMQRLASCDHRGFRETASVVPFAVHRAYPTLTKERVPHLYSGRLYLSGQNRVIHFVA